MFEKAKNDQLHVDLDVLIMAGGYGQRMKPYTDDIPKPLLPLNNKAIIQYMIDHLVKHGFTKINIAVGYLGKQVIDYCLKSNPSTVKFNFIQESIPLGTIGSSVMIPSSPNKDILVVNADLVTDINFYEFYKKYKASHANICIATTPYAVQIPYAIIAADQERVVSIVEKPQYHYLANAGMYIIDKKVLSFIPKSQKYDTPELIEVLLKNKYPISHYVMIESWMDISTVEDYERLNKQ